MPHLDLIMIVIRGSLRYSWYCQVHHVHSTLFWPQNYYLVFMISLNWFLTVFQRNGCYVLGERSNEETNCRKVVKAFIFQECKVSWTDCKKVVCWPATTMEACERSPGISLSWKKWQDLEVIFLEFQLILFWIGCRSKMLHNLLWKKCLPLNRKLYLRFEMHHVLLFLLFHFLF